MGSVGINRETGEPLTDFDHVVQSLEVIVSTVVGARVMRRTFGFVDPGLLGKNITVPTVLRFVSALHVAIALWEPRYALIQATFPGNSIPGMRAGRLGFALYGQYRPNGHLGDPTPAGGPFTLFF